ncbi:MAG TPA: ATP synthase subunit I [Negativicutes bacterium]|jgi:hypothetical protein
MQEYIIEVKRTLLQMAAWGVVTCGVAYVAGYSQMIVGLTVGTVTSMIYFLLMCYRVHKSVDLPSARAVAYMRLGWLVRLSFVVLMLVLSVHIAQIHFGAAVVGLFSLNIVMLGNAVVSVVTGIIGKTN